MSRIIDINFSYLDNTVAVTTAATLALDTRLGDCGGIRNRISSIDSNTSNLYTANTYLDKKKKALREKRDNLRQFNKDVISFGAFAKAQDVKTAAAIYISGHKFYHREGIAHGPLYTVAAVIGDGVKWLAEKASKRVQALISGIKQIGQTIKEFYEKNKYLLDVIKDGLGVIAAVIALAAAASPLAAAVAIWGLCKVITSLNYDAMALKMYNDGNLAAAEELNGKDLGDLMGTAFGETGKRIYHGLNIAAFVFDATEFAKNAKYIFSLKTLDSKWSNVLSPETIKSIKHSGKILALKMTTGIDFKPTDFTSVFKNIKATYNAILGFADKGWEEGSIGGIKITHDIHDFFGDLYGLAHPSAA